MTCRIRPFRSNSGVFIRTGRCKRDSYSSRSRSSCVFGRFMVGAVDMTSTGSRAAMCVCACYRTSGS